VQLLAPLDRDLTHRQGRDHERHLCLSFVVGPQELAQRGSPEKDVHE
jgi:hypothetical protein